MQDVRKAQEVTSVKFEQFKLELERIDAKDLRESAEGFVCGHQQVTFQNPMPEDDG